MGMIDLNHIFIDVALPGSNYAEIYYRPQNLITLVENREVLT